MSASQVFESSSLDQTMALAAAVARCCHAGDLIALSGDLGAGKTQFVRGLARGLGIGARHVSSPTFVIAHEYEPDPDQGSGGGVVLVHVDAYRLQGPADLETIGWGDDGRELRDGAVVAIEWADRVLDALGPDYLSVTLEHTADGRRITLTPSGDWSRKLQSMEVSPQ